MTFRFANIFMRDSSKNLFHIRYPPTHRYEMLTNRLNKNTWPMNKQPNIYPIENNNIMYDIQIGY